MEVTWPHSRLEKRNVEWDRISNRRAVLVNSFWGLDKGESIPPNFVMTGPMSKPPDQAIEDFKEKDNDLFEWMNKAQEEKRDVVLITIGSECKWQ